MYFNDQNILTYLAYTLDYNYLEKDDYFCSTIITIVKNMKKYLIVGFILQMVAGVLTLDVKG